MNLDFLECGVCLDIFKPPIFMLSCGHDFCYDCLLGAFSNNNACPECRAVQSVEHIDQLNRNRRLEKAVLSLKTTKTVERRAEEEDYSALILRAEEDAEFGRHLINEVFETVEKLDKQIKNFTKSVSNNDEDVKYRKMMLEDTQLSLHELISYFPNLLGLYQKFKSKILTKIDQFINGRKILLMAMR